MKPHINRRSLFLAMLFDTVVGRLSIGARGDEPDAQPFHPANRRHPCRFQGLAYSYSQRLWRSPRSLSVTFGNTRLATRIFAGYDNGMKAELTAIIETAPEGGYWAICPEVPGANGQGETVDETKKNLIEAIELIFDDRRADILRGLPEDAIQEKILVG